MGFVPLFQFPPALFVSSQPKKTCEKKGKRFEKLAPNLSSQKAENKYR
jgi:hypothetical protein